MNKETLASIRREIIYNVFIFTYFILFTLILFLKRVREYIWLWILMAASSYFLVQSLHNTLFDHQKISETHQDEECDPYYSVKIPHACLFDFGYKLHTLFGIFFLSTTTTENYATLIEFATQFKLAKGESSGGTYYLGYYDIPTDQKLRSMSTQRQQDYLRQIQQHITTFQRSLQKHIPGVKFQSLNLQGIFEEHGLKSKLEWGNQVTADFVFLGKIKLTVRDDVLLLTREHPENPKEKEQVLISVIGVTSKVKDNFQLLDRIGEGQVGVSTWRWNRVEKRKKNQHKIFTTQNFIIIKATCQDIDYLSSEPLKYMEERLRKTQNDVLSVIKNGFECTLLKNEELIRVFLHKNQVKAGKAKVRYDNAYFRAIARLSRVPSRTIPLLPCNTAPVNIPLGTSFINPQKTVGLGKLADLLVFCGSDQKLLIGALQHFIKTILTPERKIVILDYNNELGKLAQGAFNVTTLQLGKNFSFNLYDVEIPSHISEYNSQIACQTNTVVHMLAYASETDEIFANLAQLRYAMVEATKEFSPRESREELSLQNITKSDVFTDIFQTTDHLTLDRLGTELKYFSTSSELNDGKKHSDAVKNLGRTPGITLIQYPTQIYAHKRLAFVFLLQKLAAHCDAQTVVIVTHASKLLGKENTPPQRRIFEDSINQHYTKIRQSGCLVLSTHSVTDLHPEVQKNISTGIFFTLQNVEDRDWVTVRYALEAKLGADVPNVSAFLKSLHQEGLLFRDDVSTTFDFFVPFTFNPIDPNDSAKILPPAPPSLDDLLLNEKQFFLLMTVLGQLQSQEVTEQAMIQYLHGLGHTDMKDDWDHLCKLPYFNLTKNGKDQILSLSSEGQMYNTRIDNLINQLPPPISLDSQAIDSTLNKLHHQVEQSSYNDSIEQYQLKTLIEEVAGALLNESLQIQGTTDWDLVKKYVDLVEIEGVDTNHHTQRLKLLERLYMEIEEKTKLNSPA